jgi:RNA polymerase sigma factor (sigma-70 family)
VVDRAVRTRFREGDPDAVRAVYRSYGRVVYAVAYKVLGDRALAEDAVQQAFVKAWRAAATFDEDRELGPWLAAIARRTAIDVYRRETVRSSDPLDSVAPGNPALTTEPETSDIHDAWAVREAVDQLPEDEREIVRLQHFEGLTHAEIADRLNLALGTVKSRSFRAHKRLATVLGYLQE